MDAVAPAPVPSPHLMAMDPLPHSSEPLDRPLGAFVSDVGAKGDTLEVETLESVTHQQQFRLRIYPRFPQGAAEPCGSDLDVGVGSVKVPVGSGADDDPTFAAADGKRKPPMSIPIGKRVGDPGLRGIEVARSRVGQPGEDLVGIGGGQDALCVLGRKGLGRDDVAAQLDGFHRVHGAILSRSLTGLAGVNRIGQ